MDITGALYPEVRELLEADVGLRRRELEDDALTLLNHPDARFERHPGCLEDRFVTYRLGDIGWQTISVPVPSRSLLSAQLASHSRPITRAGAVRERQYIDELRTAALTALITLLENEVR